MYPFASVEGAWDELWTAVHRRAPWTPERLTRSGDVHARWYDTDCLVTHVCGWPFAALHRNDMTLIGSFTLDLPEADDAGHYHSVLLSTRNVELEHLIRPDVRVVANSADSLSGWISLLAATVGPGNEWPGPIAFTSAHRDSLIAMAKGEADLACIDSLTLSFIRDEEPELLADLHQVGLGPRIPTPAITARTSLGTDRIGQLADALRAAVNDPSIADARRALRIVEMSSNTIDDYLATLALHQR